MFATKHYLKRDNKKYGSLCSQKEYDGTIIQFIYMHCSHNSLRQVKAKATEVIPEGPHPAFVCFDFGCKKAKRKRV